MITQQEIVIKAKEYAESIGNEDGLSAYDYAKGYNDCQAELEQEREKDLYSKIENLIVIWSNDGTKTAGTLTRQIIKLLNKDYEK
jgi:hypothetical protein